MSKTEKKEVGETYIKIYRGITDNWLWGKERKTKFEAWIYILLNANWKDAKYDMGYELVEIKRGQFMTSQDKLSKAFRWDRSSVRKFLNMLKTDRMIDTVSTEKYTMITICKYDSYQGNLPTTDQQRNSSLPSTQQQPPTTKNNKEEYKNNEELSQYKKFSDWIDANAPRVNKMKEPFSIDQYEELKKKYNPNDIADMLKKMHNYEPLTRKNVSAYLTILNWLKKEVPTDPSKTRIIDINQNGLPGLLKKL